MGGASLRVALIELQANFSALWMAASILYAAYAAPYKNKIKRGNNMYTQKK